MGIEAVVFTYFLFCLLYSVELVEYFLVVGYRLELMFEGYK